MIVRSILFGLLVLACAGTPAFSQATWTDNMSQAMRRAKAENKDLLLNFTGSDWCHWCHVLEEEVFGKKVFEEQAPKHFVLVTLDFPADEAKQDPKLAKQNHEWLEKLGVDGFPTIILCDSSGRPYATKGYEKGGAKPYLEALERAVEFRKTRDRLMAEARKLTGIDRAKTLDEALSGLDRVLVARSYKAEVAEILKLAASDDGLLAKYRRLELLGKQRRALTEMEELAVTKDKKRVKERLAEMAKLFVEESEERSEFEFMRMEVLTEAKLHEEAIAHARKVIERDKDSFDAAMARETVLENLLGLGKPDAVLESADKWSKELETAEALELQVYKIDALVAMKKKAKAVSVAVGLLRDAKKAPDSPDYIVEWLDDFVQSRGEGATYLEFANGDVGMPVASEFWIGVAVEPVEQGLQVLDTVPESPAMKAGMREGDVLVRMNDKRVDTIDLLISTIGDNGAKEMTVEWIRDGAVVKKSITPEKRPASMMVPQADFELGPIPETWRNDFGEAVALAKKEDKELVVFFSAKWCGPCQAMLLETIPDKNVEEKLKERVVVFLDLDTKDGAGVARDFKIEAIPTYLFLNPDEKELGRAFGFLDSDQFMKALEKRGGSEGFEAADTNSDGKVKLREFRIYATERLGDGMPLRKMFREIDKDQDKALSPEEFEERLSVIQKFMEKPATAAYADPGPDFVPYPGGAAAVNDAKVFGAVVHRYRELVAEGDKWPTIEIGRVPASIAQPDLSSARECKSASDLARASLIVAGGDEMEGGFFTAGAVLVSSDGLAVTNYHVVEDLDRVRMMAMDSSGKAHRIVEVLAGSKERDVALIRIEGSGFHGVKIARAAPVAGDDLVMMHHSEMRFFTYDRGYVMRYSQISNQPWMEVSAEYAPGGSGCGLFNKQHQLVGLVSSITMGDGPDLAADDSLENEDSDLEEWGDEEPVTFGALVVKHAVPWSAIDSLWKKPGKE